MRGRLIPIFLFLVISFFVFIFSGIISYPINFITFLASGPRAFIYSVANAEGNPSEIDNLKAENAKLLDKLIQMNSLKKDNEALRSQFQDSVISPEKMVPAKVVGFSGSLDNPSVLILDQGSKNNIKMGMAVVAKHNLVGKIGKVSDWNSELILPVNKNFFTLAVTTDHNSPGIINGEEDFILLNHVVITDTISKNELVVTKGEKNSEGVGIPPNLIIGKITTVYKSETQPFQSGIVKNLIDYKKLSTVFIITK